MQRERRPVFVSGRVVRDDGTPPSERVTIERVCNGRVHRETYTDSQGRFSFRMGGESQMFQDASVGKAPSTRNPGYSGSDQLASGTGTGTSQDFTQEELLNCELRANLPGYHSDSISLGGRQVFDNPDVGMIVLHRIDKVEGTKISVTTLHAPPEARKAFECAHNAGIKNHRAEAAQELQRAVALYPKYAEALAQLGVIYFDQNRKQEATRVLQQAIEADPKFVPPYATLSSVAGEQHDWAQMAELSQRALALNPYEYPAGYFNHAIANYNLQNLDAAEKSARAARRLDAQYHSPRIDYLLANILLRRNDYAGAAELLKTFLKYTPIGEEANEARGLLQRTESKLAEVQN